jgi:putative aminopeptidase FrvX
MGVLGVGIQGDEYSCSICAKDSGGPYDYRFRKELVQIAEEKKIPYKLDVYPFYSSDGTAALRAGRDYRVALIGPGVAASHGMERTNVNALEATVDLCMAYINR